VAFVDSKKPYIQVERAAGNTAVIHVVMPDGSRLGVFIERTDDNGPAFDYLAQQLKGGLNI
jgi:hypothetical protein